MADVGIYTKNADIAARAGANVNSTAITTAETDKYVLAVEAYINAITRVDWSSKWTAGTLTANAKEILTEASACYCAMLAINYDLSSFPSRVEAETMLDVLRDRFVNAMKALDDVKVKTFLGGV